MWELYVRSDGRWAWRLVAANGNVLANDAGQGYENRSDAARIVDGIRTGRYSGLPVKVTTDRARS